MVHRVLYLLACSCIAGQDSDATAATQSEQDLPTMNSGAMITTIIHFTLRQTVAKRDALGGGMLDVQRMVSVERTLIGVRDPVDAFGWQGAVGGEDACVEGHLDGGREVEQRR